MISTEENVVNMFSKRTAWLAGGKDDEERVSRARTGDADELMVKSRLMSFLGEEIRKRRLTQKGAGELLGLDRSNVWALVNEKVSRFSIKKLMTLAGRLGFAVTIHMVSAVVALSCLTLGDACFGGCGEGAGSRRASALDRPCGVGSLGTALWRGFANLCAL
jgi:predicted XRE-type DNA-binding protein